MADKNFIEDNKIGGDFVSPDASFAAKKFIIQSRTMMYDDPDIFDKAIAGAENLVDGSVPIVAMVVSSVESKLGELNDQDLRMVAFHLAGTIVERAKEEGEPEAMEEDGKTATMEITEGVVELMNEQDNEAQEGGMVEGAEQMPPEQPQPLPLMQSAGGQP